MKGDVAKDDVVKEDVVKEDVVKEDVVKEHGVTEEIVMAIFDGIAVKATWIVIGLQRQWDYTNCKCDCNGWIAEKIVL